MTRRYFALASLSLIALTILGCGDGEDGNKSPLQIKNTPGAGDEDDKLFDEKRPDANSDDYEEDGVIDGPAEEAEEYYGAESAAMRFRYRGTYRAYGRRNGGRMAWRIPKVGMVGSKALVRFASGRQYLVILGKANRSSNGFVFKKGSHGGYYIHAIYGDNSSTVTVYWG